MRVAIKPWSVTLGLFLTSLAVLPSLSGAANDKGKAQGRAYAGFVVPARQARVSPKVAGQVVELLVEIGQIVKKGEVLARLDDRRARIAVFIAEARLEQAKAHYAEVKSGPAKEEIAQAEAGLEETKALYKQAQLEKERAMILVRTARNAISQRDLDEIIGKERQLVSRLKKAQAALDLLKQGPRKERLAVAEAEIKQAEARLVGARDKMESTVVRAPIDGTILATHVQAGESVNPLGPNRSAALCDLADLTRLEVVVDIPEGDLALVSRGQACQVQLTSMLKVKLEGRVTSLAPFVDPIKGTCKARIALEVGKNEGKILPGMSARARFPVKE